MPDLVELWHALQIINAFLDCDFKSFEQLLVFEEVMRLEEEELGCVLLDVLLENFLPLGLLLNLLGFGL